MNVFKQRFYYVVAFIVSSLLNPTEVFAEKNSIDSISSNFGSSLPARHADSVLVDSDLKSSLSSLTIDKSRPTNVFGALQTDHQASGTFRGREMAMFKRASPVNLFKSVSRSVVLILTDSGSGTGSVVDESGGILTNWHVVGDSQFVDVIFRPDNIAQEIYAERSYRAEVQKVDQVSDLAIIKLLESPPQSTSVKFTDSPPEIGEDVFAIGHPHGYTWTMTQGIVTGRRDNYNWQYSVGYQHSADVIQTQTPINPGNSGGPLFNEKMQVVGINSFGGEGQGTNFAVSSSSVAKFLASAESRRAPAIPGTKAMTSVMGACDEWKLLEQPWESLDETSTLTLVDINCDGNEEGVLELPYDEEQWANLYIDTIQDGKVDVTLSDIDRDGVWDISFYDLNADGEADVVGYHSESSTPDSFVSFARFKSEMSATNS